jgi:pyrophosphatase PpaX
MMQKLRLPQPITTVLFDLDDTLIDSFPACVETLNHVFRYAGMAKLDASSSLQNLRGVAIKDILLQCGVNREIVNELFYEYRRAYWTREHSCTIDVFPGIKSMLEKLFSSGLKLGVVTQKGRDFQFEGYPAGAVVELEKTEIIGLFSVIIGLEDVSQTKPHPEGINKALDRLGSSGKETLFVGDSLADMTAAQSAGCWSCHAKWGVVSSENYQADFIIETPEELLGIIKNYHAIK